MLTLRSAVPVVSAALAAGLVTAAPGSAATAFTVSGTWIGHSPPYPEQLVPGYFSGDSITNIAYPAAVFGMDSSVAVAAAGLERAVESTAGQVVLGGFSQGAIAVAYAMRAVMAMPADQRPASDQLSFVTLGDPTARGGILRFIDAIIPVLELTPVLMPDTPYDAVVVNGEYDGWGDFPDRPQNLLSVVNALLGTIYVHGHYEVIPGGLDLSAVPESHITTTVNSLGGRTTSYLIPTARLPLLQPLRDIGVPEDFLAAIEAPLRAIVDAGYARNDAPALSGAEASRAVPARSAETRGSAQASGKAATSGARHRGGTAPAAS